MQRECIVLSCDFLHNWHLLVPCRFRLVALQLRELQDCHSEDVLETQLKCLPDGVEKIYDQIISKLNKKHREDALKILQWLAFSARPLLLDEIAQVVGVVFDLDHGLCFKPSCLYPDPQSVLHVCSSLVTQAKGNSELETIIIY